MEVQVSKLTINDIEKFNRLIRIFADIFEMNRLTVPPPSRLIALLSKDDFIALVAEVNGQVIGGLTSYVLQQYYAVQPQVFIYDLAVVKNFQRQGVAKLLMTDLTHHCQENGYEQMFVLAHDEDEHALQFYRSTGGMEESVRSFTYTLHS